MDALHDVFPEKSPVPSYLEKVALIHREVLGRDLIALYLHGSLVQNDFHPGSSDLDILGVVASAINATKRKQLVERLSHTFLPVPALGLELILCTAEAVRTPVATMPFEFALSTGMEWGVQVETRGAASDILINIQLCRQAALALHGPPAPKVFRTVPRAPLQGALIGELDWHLKDLLTAKPGKAAANAILNSARSVHAANTGEIISKSQGGRLWLANSPEDTIVAVALSYREGLTQTAPDTQAVSLFVEKVRVMISAALE